MLLKGLATVALSLPVALAAMPARIAPGHRVELKVLLLSADGTESGFQAWKAQLEREGVPYDSFVAFDGQRRAATLTDGRLADYGAGVARYQAVILATGDLGHNVINPGGTTSYLSALTDAEWAALAKFERTFGIRRLSDYTAPAAARGLSAVPGAWQDGIAAELTPAGKAAFPYLRGRVLIADDAPGPNEAFGYAAQPVAGAPFQALLAGPGGSALMGVYTHPDDGREELVMTVSSNQVQNHNQLLRHGMLNWATRGVFVGSERHYLALQIDDLFLGDDVWDPVANVTRYDQSSRMTPADVDRAIAWSNARGLHLDMAFNGGGAEAGDALAAHLRNPSVRDAFRYINHTDTHANLDCSTASFIRDQIRDNVSFARANGLPVDGVTAGGVTTIASDASKAYPSTPTVLTSPLLPAGASFVQGAVRAVPRYPSNVYYSVSRQGQQLDEYDWIYVNPPVGGCVPIPLVTTCRAVDATWAEYVASATQVMFRHLTGNDPRPHYFHQSNLADSNPALPDVHPDQGGILYPVIDALVGRYEAAFDRDVARLVQLTPTEIAATLARQEAWAAQAASVSAWLQDGRVYARNRGTTPIAVPLTGIAGAEPYGGQRSTWVTLAPGREASFAPAEPAATRAPAVTGTARVGERLEPDLGAWTGTPPITYARQWQRCGATCVDIADVADIVVVFEGSYAEYRAWRQPAWVEDLVAAHLVYAAPPARAHAARPARPYLTTGTLPHPWGTVVTPRTCA